MATAMLSLLLGKPVHRNIAMTGEITLRGEVLPVGGIKEKVLAAKRARINSVILPALNHRDLEDINDDLRRNMTFIFVERVDEVLNKAIIGETDFFSETRTSKKGIQKAIKTDKTVKRSNAAKKSSRKRVSKKMNPLRSLME